MRSAVSSVLIAGSFPRCARAVSAAPTAVGPRGRPRGRSSRPRRPGPTSGCGRGRRRARAASPRPATRASAAAARRGRTSPRRETAARARSGRSPPATRRPRPWRCRSEDGSEREPAEKRRKRSEHGERGGERAADGGHRREQRDRDDHPDPGPREDPRDELADADRSRDDRVVRLEPLEAGLDRKRRRARGRLHRRRREQRRSDELQVSETTEVGVRAVDELSEQEADRDEEEDRVQERHRDRAAPQSAGTTGRASRRPRACGGRAHQSTRLRPVRRRKTSSRVAAADEDSLGVETERVHAVDDRVAVVRADHDPVLQHLDMAPIPSSDGASPSVPTRRSSTTSRSTNCSMSARGEPSATIFALVHDHEAVAELLGLVHVVGREDERDAALLQAIEAVPQRVARLRVEPRGRLVEQHSSGSLISARAMVRRRFMPPESESTRASLRSASCTNSSSSSPRRRISSRGRPKNRP